MSGTRGPNSPNPAVRTGLEAISRAGVDSGGPEAAETDSTQPPPALADDQDGSAGEIYEEGYEVTNEADYQTNERGELLEIPARIIRGVARISTIHGLTYGAITVDRKIIDGKGSPVHLEERSPIPLDYSYGDTLDRLAAAAGSRAGLTPARIEELTEYRRGDLWILVGPNGDLEELAAILADLDAGSIGSAETYIERGGS